MKRFMALLCVLMMIPAAVSAEIMLRAGGSFAFALDSQGQLWGWGDNTKGQLGNGSKKRAFFPDTQAGQGLDGQEILDIQCGNENTLYLMNDGSVYTSGPNNYGQQGNGKSNAYNYVPEKIEGLEHIVQISSGYGHCLALDENGHVFAWGRNNLGQCGVGKNRAVNKPEQLELEHITSIVCGGKYCVAMDENGRVFGWGSNDQGQLLDTGRNKKVLSPVELALDFRPVQLACGGSTTYALDEEGSVWAWGRNNYLQLGTKSVRNASKVPVRVELPENTEVREVYAYNTHSGVMTTDGQIIQWGMTRCGQLGSGKHPTSSLPTLCELDQKAIAFDVGSSGSYVMLEDGSILACGYGEVGQTGAFRRKTAYVYVWTSNGLNAVTGTWVDPKND